jgi:hypothetical protein
VFLWGKPIFVSKNTGSDEIEKIRIDLENTLKTLTEQADDMACGK